MLRSLPEPKGVELGNGDRISAPVVVNAAGPHSGALNEVAGVLDDFRVRTRPLRQEVHSLPAPADYQLFDGHSPVVNDCDLGTYFRPQPGGTVLVGGMEPACDPLHWADTADELDVRPTQAVWDAQVLRLARRMPALQIPNRPKGVAHYYDVSDDWIPIYDRTSLNGYYVAIGTSGNQFKNTPIIGHLMRAVIEGCEAGRDHDANPIEVVLPRTRHRINLSHYSRRREVHTGSSFSVMG